MSKPTTEATTTEAARPAAAAARVIEARLQAGSVHWNGARPVTHITTVKAQTAILGTHILQVEELSLHPAGLLIKVDGQSWIVPHSRVETYRLA